MDDARCDEMLRALRGDADDHEMRIRALEAASERRNEQMKNIYEALGGIKTLIAQLAIKIDTAMGSMDSKLGTELEKIDKRLKKLEQADGEKWKQAVWIVFALVVGAVVGRLRLGG